MGNCDTPRCNSPAELAAQRVTSFTFQSSRYASWETRSRASPPKALKLSNGAIHAHRHGASYIERSGTVCTPSPPAGPENEKLPPGPAAFTFSSPRYVPKKAAPSTKSRRRGRDGVLSLTQVMDAGSPSAAVKPFGEHPKDAYYSSIDDWRHLVLYYSGVSPSTALRSRTVSGEPPMPPQDYFSISRTEKGVTPVESPLVSSQSCTPQESRCLSETIQIER